MDGDGESECVSSIPVPLSAEHRVDRKPRPAADRFTCAAYRFFPRAGWCFFQRLQMVIGNRLPVGPVQHAGDGEADVHAPRLRSAFQGDNQTEAAMDFSSFPSVKVGRCQRELAPPFPTTIVSRIFGDTLPGISSGCNGQYFKVGSSGSGNPASTPPAYPTHAVLASDRSMWGV
jgi:hypothetical protein